MRLRAFVLSNVLVFAVTGSALAQSAESTSTADAARALYVEGKELREAGDLNRSLEKLEAAHALYATPITALEVGRARALVGKLRGAIEVLESIERLPRKPNESPKAVSAREEAKTLLAQYRARIPKLVIHADGVDVRVTVDGEVVPGDALGTPWFVDPGTHHVEADRRDGRASQDVRVAEGEQRDVTLKLGPAAPPSPVGPAAPPPTRPAPPAREAPTSGSPNVLAYVGFGLGGVALGIGTVTGILTLARAGDIKGQCRNGVCPPEAGLDSAQTLGTVSTVGFVVAGVGVGVGAAALLFGARHDSRISRGAWVEPWIAGSSVGVRGGF